jgi:anaerobic magnesium-protoporphyrin IX monomethyl ester cyclase
MSAVNASGHHAFIMTYGSDPEAILNRIGRVKPDVVGFSLIFQYMAPDFARVIAALRETGVTAHFTMGGHYASFEPWRFSCAPLASTPWCGSTGR